MPDRFDGRAPSLQSPASHAFPITPNDAGDLSETTRALYVAAGGSLAVVMASGATVSFAGIAGGTTLPLRVARVRATGTTASGLVGLV